MAILYTKKRFGNQQGSAINPNIEAGLRNRYAEIGTALANAKKQALAIQPKLTTLAKARDAGMPITPQTSVEQAQKFVSQPKTQPTPKTQQPKVSLFDKIRNTLTSILPQKQKPEAFGIPQKSQALTNVEKEIANTEAKYAQTAERWKNEAMGKGLTETYLRGQLGRLERQKSIELTSLRAKQRALQGDLTNAQKLAQYAATQAQRDFENRYRITSLALNEAEKEANRQQKQQIEAMRAQLDAYKQAQNRIYQLMVKYPDAGILPSDSWQTIQRKVKGSSLYQKAIRIPASKTAKTTTTTSTLKPYWSKTDYKKLSGLGVPRDVADTVSAALQKGLSLEAIRRALASEYGKETGYHYLDTIMLYLQSSKSSSGAGFSAQ